MVKLPEEKGQASERNEPSRGGGSCHCLRKENRGVIRWYRESHATYGFQPEGASEREELLVVSRDQIKTVDEMRAGLLA